MALPSKVQMRRMSVAKMRKRGEKIHVIAEALEITCKDVSNDIYWINSNGGEHAAFKVEA